MRSNNSATELSLNLWTCDKRAFLDISNATLHPLQSGGSWKRKWERNLLSLSGFSGRWYESILLGDATEWGRKKETKNCFFHFFSSLKANKKKEKKIKTRLNKSWHFQVCRRRTLNFYHHRRHEDKNNFLWMENKFGLCVGCEHFLMGISS